MTSNRRQTLFFRVDADHNSGGGHFMRCLALAQAWRRAGGQAFFISHCSIEALRKRATYEYIHLVELDRPNPAPDDLATTQKIITRETSLNSRPWLVVDGYHFDAAYHEAVRRSARLMLIDDNNDRELGAADAILNLNIHAPDLDYGDAADQTCLLGPDYALLREEFYPYLGREHLIPDEAGNILITMGKSDPRQVTRILVEALNFIGLDSLHVRIILDPAHPDFDFLRARAADLPFRTEFLGHVDDMSAVMAWADLALTTASSTCWELAFMGVPALTVSTADNQRILAEYLDKHDLYRHLGWWENLEQGQIAENIRALLCNPSGRRRISTEAQRLVDGQGAERVCAFLSGESTFDSSSKIECQSGNAHR